MIVNLSLRRVAAAAAVTSLVAGASFAQVKPKAPAKPPQKHGVTSEVVRPRPPLQTPGPAGSGGWKPSRTSASTLAAGVDRAFQTMRSVSGQSRFVVNIPQGTGYNGSTLSVVSPTKYRLEYPYLPSNYKRYLGQALVCDGKKFGIFAEVGGFILMKPLAQRPSLIPAKVLPGWPREFPRYMFATVGTTQRPFSRLVAEALAPSQQLTVASEERTVVQNGRKATFHRLLFTRKKGSKLGALSMEIIVDGSYLLPITFRNVFPGAKGVWNTFWTARWNFQKNQKFEGVNFTVAPSGPLVGGLK